MKPSHKKKLSHSSTVPKTTAISYLFFTMLMITSLACLQTAMIAESPTDPAPTKTAILQQTSEPDSGAVYEIPTQGQKQTCAIVTAVQSLNLRELPSEKSKAISWLPANTIVIVVGRVGDWWKVESAVGDGYARAQYLKESECE